MKVKLKFKYSIFLSMLLILTVGMLSFLVLRAIRINQMEEHERYLFQQAKIVNSYVNQLYIKNSYENHEKFLEEQSDEIVKYIKSINDLNAVIFNMKGKKISTIDLKYEKEYDEKLIYYGLQKNIAYKNEKEYITYVAPIYNKNQVGIIKFQYDLKKSNDFYKKIRSHFINIGSFVFIFSFLIAYIYFHRYTKVILKLKKFLINIKEGNYKKVSIIKRRDELGDLSEGIFYLSNEIYRNIENMKSEEKKLNLAINKLKALEKQQKTFIGNITHELKTPLTVIKAYLDLIDMYEDDSVLLKDAKLNIRKESEVLQDMVEKVLYLSSLEKYEFELQSEKVNIKELLEEVYKRMEGKAKKFNIKMEVSLENAFILGDKEGIIHIFMNLIDNAIKYNTSDGNVLIKNYIQEDLVFIEIEDTGIGILEEEKEKIFEPFYRSYKHSDKKLEGTGIGLSLVKELVERQKGKINILKSETIGTTFLLNFPLAK
ncbi:sensor histidine kinase [Clostridium tarantellae]|uniref:histidine kinase n=1 Tax=Clostridium tarantellae TaxID=39493 RepID=A0A6I1MM93_9CLOT|nr:HAMP domain-containing sensor histidine kinase [Clostridium tarantellae]MPQ44100.1 GHKL domain-containing protein [Clostridium tarantellae]